MEGGGRDHQESQGFTSLFGGDEGWLSHLDLDDILHEACHSNMIIMVIVLLLVIMVIVRGVYDFTFWMVMILSALLSSIYVYWSCIRSPSQYYSSSNMYSGLYFQSRTNTQPGAGRPAGGEPAEILTTDDIINTTTYQAAPAFGGGSSSSMGGTNY
jgi:hypothetical protein